MDWGFGAVNRERIASSITFSLWRKSRRCSTKSDQLIIVTTGFGNCDKVRCLKAIFSAREQLLSFARKQLLFSTKELSMLYLSFSLFLCFTHHPNHCRVYYPNFTQPKLTSVSQTTILLTKFITHVISSCLFFRYSHAHRQFLPTRRELSIKSYMTVDIFRVRVHGGEETGPPHRL